MAPCWKEEGHASTGLAKCSNIVFGLHSDHSPSASLFAGFGHGGWPGVGLPGGSDSKDSACSEEDLGLIPGLGGSPGGGMATHSSILAWRISWTEEPGRL